MSATATPEPIAVGDEFVLRVRVVEVQDAHKDPKLVTFVVNPTDGSRYHESLAFVGRAFLEAGTRQPRPLKVGDRVRFSEVGGVGSIKAIDGSEAWVLFDGSSMRTTHDLETLYRT